MSEDTAPVHPETVFVLETKAQLEDALAIRPHLPGPVAYLAFSTAAAEALAGEAAAVGDDRVWTTPWLRLWSLRLAKLVSVLHGRAIIRRLTQSGPSPVFVFGNDMNSVDRALIQFAAGRGAKSVLVQDGVLDERDFAEFIKRPQSVASRLALALSKTAGLVPALVPYGAGRCDGIAVFGPRTRELLVGRGVPVSQITVTGSPRFATILRARHDIESTTEIRRVLYLGVVLGTARIAPDSADDAWTQALESMVRDRPSWEVVLRPHPQDPIDRYSRIQVRCPALRIDARSAFHDLLKATDAVVAHFPSTGVLESLAFGKPVVFLNLGFSCSKNLYTADEGLVATTQPDGLVTTLERTVREQAVPSLVSSRDALLFGHLGPLDGNSGERAAEVIESLRGARRCQEAVLVPRPN